jgi:cysteine synthase
LVILPKNQSIIWPNHNVWIKLERATGASIKDRIALSMIETQRKRIVEKRQRHYRSDSGNTGIGLAMVAAVKATD